MINTEQVMVKIYLKQPWTFKLGMKCAVMLAKIHCYKLAIGIANLSMRRLKIKVGNGRWGKLYPDYKLTVTIGDYSESF